MKKRIYLKKPIRLFLAVVFVLIASFAFLLIFHDSASGNNIPEYATIVIAKGDTLWNIAKKYNYDNIDIRSKISEIKELNKIPNVNDYKILRYRDDYKIFAHNDGELNIILKKLSEVLSDLNFI